MNRPIVLTIALLVASKSSVWADSPQSWLSLSTDPLLDENGESFDDPKSVTPQTSTIGESFVTQTQALELPVQSQAGVPEEVPDPGEANQLAEILKRLDALEKSVAKPAAAADKKPNDGWTDISSEKWTVKLGGHVQMDYIIWADTGSEHR